MDPIGGVTYKITIHSFSADLRPVLNQNNRCLKVAKAVNAVVLCLAAHVCDVINKDAWLALVFITP